MNLVTWGALPSEVRQRCIEYTDAKTVANLERANRQSHLLIQGMTKSPLKKAKVIFLYKRLSDPQDQIDFLLANEPILRHMPNTRFQITYRAPLVPTNVPPLL